MVVLMPDSEQDADITRITVRESLPITLFDSVALAIRGDDGLIYLALSDICQIVNLAPTSQLRRIRGHEDLVEGLVRANVNTGYGFKEQYFLQIDLYPLWMLGVNTRKSDARKQGRLRHLKRYLISEVYAAFARAAALPESSSRAIEDLHDLDHLEEALTNLETRQDSLEISQERARTAWKDLDARVRALEGQTEERISAAQRGYLYTLVQAWGQARAERQPETARNPYAACWASLKMQFRINNYQELRQRDYPAAIAFIRQSYRQLTGTDLDIPEQSSLDL
jgi:hypothetical protein